MRTRSPLLTLACVTALALGATAQPLTVAGQTDPAAAPQVAGCDVLPADDIWNTPVDTLPVDAASDAYIATIGAEDGLHPDFGSGLYEGGPIGIPYVVVGADQAPVAVSFLYAEESDPGPYPIPADAPIEGGPDGEGDRHVLVVDAAACTLYELFNALPRDDGSWQADAGAVYDLGSSALRPDGWTSADAAGLPILPGLVRYDEVAAGEIRHALRFTAPDTRRDYVWPARHFASRAEKLDRRQGSDVTKGSYRAFGIRPDRIGAHTSPAPAQPDRSRPRGIRCVAHRLLTSSFAVPLRQPA